MARILYAEDDPSIAALVDFRLSVEDHTVVLASDGETAREHLGSGGFDVVLLDVMLPGVDGFALTAQAAALEPRPVVIMVTARDRADDVAAAREAGADAFISKPFDPEDLVAVIEEHLAG